MIKIGLVLGRDVCHEVWNLIGAANKQLGRLNGAVNAFGKVAELDIQNANIFNNLGVSLRLLAIMRKPCRPKKSNMHRRELSRSSLQYCQYSERTRQTQEASEVYQAAIENRHNYPQALNNLGSVYHDAGEIEKAINCYSKAVSFEGNYAEAYQNMAVALHDQMNLLQQMLFKVFELNCNPTALKNLANLVKDQDIFMMRSNALRSQWN